jgi:hypothetical protein
MAIECVQCVKKGLMTLQERLHKEREREREREREFV